MLNPLVRRTWAAAGFTPVLYHRLRSYKHLAAIGALSISPRGTSTKSASPSQYARSAKASLNASTTRCAASAESRSVSSASTSAA